MVILESEILKFAEQHFNRRHDKAAHESSFGRWNVRQIRSAFMIASSLVHYDHQGEMKAGGDGGLEEPEVKIQKQLGRTHFDIVAETTLLYDHYREAVHSGKSENHVAAEREERATPFQTRPLTPNRLKDPGKSLG